MKLIQYFACLTLVASSIFAGDTSAARKAPELAFHLPGEGQRLLSQYRGKVVAIEFIFTTCPHCQAAAKVNSKLYSEYASRGFQMIDLAINLNDHGPISDQQAASMAQEFATTYGANFPVGWVDKNQMLAFMDFSIMDRLVVPQIVLIDRKGFIRYQTPATSGPEWEKVMNEPALHAHIEELLGAPKPVHVASAKK
jgi:thiol-disulfide isomerase/thioredoxin